MRSGKCLMEGDARAGPGRMSQHDLGRQSMSVVRNGIRKQDGKGQEIGSVPGWH